MGLVLWRLVRRPAVLISVDRFIAPLKKLPGLTNLFQRQISSAPSRRNASAAIQSVDYKASEGQHIVRQEGDVSERILLQVWRKVGRTHNTKPRPNIKQRLLKSVVAQADLPKSEEEEAAPKQGSGGLRYLSPLEQKDVFRKTYTAHGRSVRDRLTGWKALEFESNVGQDKASGLLVDDPKHSRDFGIWVEVLLFRQRVYGVQGTWYIWEGIKRRKLNLPVRGQNANILWNAFIAVGFEHPKLLNEVYLHARDIFEYNRTAWHSIYNKIVGHLLATDPEQAYRWHKLIEQIHLPHSSDLHYCFTQALTSKAALRVFKQIYKELNLRNMYANIVPQLCKLELYDIAHRWHYLLMERKDLPSSFDAVQPLLKHLAIYESPVRLRDLTQSLVAAGVPFTASISHAYPDNPVISRETMSRLLGEVHSIAPKSFSDEFCARLFATKAFSIDMVMSGLRMFGMEAIGPLSLKEIASRDVTTAAVAARMDRLEELGFSFGSSVFSRLVRKLAVEDKDEMLMGLLASDQHPDALEDPELQESLLASYHAAQDWPKFHITMAVLKCHSRPNSSLCEKNLILRSYIRQRNLTAAIGALEDMRLARVPVSAGSIRWMRKNLLRPRKPGRRPISLAVDFDDLGLLVGLWQGILRCGGYIAPLSWREVFLRLGQTRRLEELEKLALWLVFWYRPNAAKSARALSSPDAGTKRFGLVPRTLSTYNHHHPYRLLFSPVQQEAIIAWGFQTLAMKSSTTRASHERTKSWAWGLELLLKLRKHGVAVSKAHVRKVLKHRFDILYGPGTSAVPANRLARINNPYPPTVMLAEVKALWKTLFVKTPRSLSSKRRGPRRLLAQSSTLYRAGSLINDSAVQKIIDGSQTPMNTHMGTPPPLPKSTKHPLSLETVSPVCPKNIRFVPSSQPPRMTFFWTSTVDP